VLWYSAYRAYRQCILAIDCDPDTDSGEVLLNYGTALKHINLYLYVCYDLREGQSGKNVA